MIINNYVPLKEVPIVDLNDFLPYPRQESSSSYRHVKIYSRCDSTLFYLHDEAKDCLYEFIIDAVAEQDCWKAIEDTIIAYCVNYPHSKTN